MNSQESEELIRRCNQIKSNYLEQRKVLSEPAAYEIYTADMKLAIEEYNNVPPKVATPNPTERPKPMLKPGALDKIVKSCESYLDEVESGEVNDDSEQYLFEDLLNTVYGSKVWTWINSR